MVEDASAAGKRAPVLVEDAPVGGKRALVYNGLHLGLAALTPAIRARKADMNKAKLEIILVFVHFAFIFLFILKPPVDHSWRSD